MSQKFFTYKGKDYDFSRVAINLAEVQSALPPVLATVCVNYFKDSFRRQGWRDKGLKMWVKRKNNKGSNGRGILIKRGHLRNSIRKLIATWKLTEVGTNLPYAAVHNEGFKGTVQIRQHTRNQYSKEKKGRGVYSIKTRQELTRTEKRATGTKFTVRAHTRKVDIPQRQYMGDSETLNLKIDHTITKAVDTIFDL